MPNALRPFFQRLVAIIGSGGIFLFFSEFLFVNEGVVSGLVTALPGNPLGALLGLVEFTLYYAFFAYGFLIVMSLFRVRDLWMLFLTGCVFGWITEGVIIPAVYEAVPWSFAWTAIGWHAVIDVMIGWYLVRKILERNNLVLTAAIAVALGLFWGFQATLFWLEGAAAFTPEDFAIFVFLAALPWILGTFAIAKWGGNSFSPSIIESVLVGVVMLVFAAFMATPALPWSLILVPIAALTFLALWRSRSAGPPAGIFASFNDHKTGWLHFALLLLTPATAALTYPVLFNTGTGLPGTWVYGVLMFGGTLTWLIGLIRPFLKPHSLNIK